MISMDTVNANTYFSGLNQGFQLGSNAAGGHVQVNFNSQLGKSTVSEEVEVHRV